MKIERVSTESGKGQSWMFEEGRDVVIGRGSECGVHIEDRESSRAHAVITTRDGALYVRDLQSKNGTRLNGEPIGEARLYNSDLIKIGSSVLRVSEIPERPPQPSSYLHFADGDRSVVLTLNHEQADVLKGVVSSASVAEMAHENRILREVGRITQIIAAKEDGQAILQRILDEMRKLLTADVACILTRDSDQAEWQVRAASGEAMRDGALTVSRTIINRAIEDGSAILLADLASDGRFDASMSIVSHGISSAICSPLKVGETFGGVLFIDRRRRSEAFGQMDLRLTATVGNVLGIFLEKEQFELDARKKARLAAIGEVVAGLAHHVKNIVTGFKLSIANLEMAYKRQRVDMVAPCLKSIVSLEQRISDLMLNMLSYAKDRPPSPTDIDVKRLLDELVMPYSDQLQEKKIRLSVEVLPGAEHLHADERAIHTAFLNLFLNSIDALDAKEDGDEKLITIMAAPLDADGEIEFRFRDTGKGISRENLGKLFTSFFSTKGSRGTGLGLAVVRKTIVDEHHGKVSVDSEEGRWTEFTIVLPAAQKS